MLIVVATCHSHKSAAVFTTLDPHKIPVADFAKCSYLKARLFAFVHEIKSMLIITFSHPASEHHVIWKQAQRLGFLKDVN